MMQLAYTLRKPQLVLKKDGCFIHVLNICDNVCHSNPNNVMHINLA